MALLDIFAQAKKPVSQKDLIWALESKGLEGVDRVSIYRNLNQFLEAGLIHEVAANAYVTCEHLGILSLAPHVVLYCPKCATHQEICRESDQSFFEKLVGRTGFFAEPGQVLISGVCRSCTGESD